MTEPARTVFFGSGEFALPIVAALADDPAARVVGVVTTPPQPAGRGGQPRATPVAAWAAAHSLPVLTPPRLREPEAVADVARLAPELIVLADYGRLVPAAILALPRHGPLNLHPSLLPRHRGASPIQAAILAGDAATGVSLLRMDEGLDTGPLVAQLRTPIGRTETAPELEARLAGLAAELLEAQLGRWLRGEVAAVPQQADGASFTRPLRRSDGRLDPQRRADELVRQVRALQPWPGTYTETPQGRLVLWRVEAAPDAGDDAPGTLLEDGDGLAVATGDGRLRLLEVQPAGGRRMTAAALRRGRPGLVGSRIGLSPLR